MKKLLHGDKEWLKCRQEVITATEAPTLLGLNKYSSPAKMWEEKTLRTFKGNAYTFIGSLLEESVIKVVNRKMGTDFHILESELGKIFYKHDELKLGATPDAVDREVFLECKTTKPLNYLRYKYCPPPNYIMQLQTQLYCAGYELGYLAIMSTDLSVDHEKSTLSEDEYVQQEFPITIFKVPRDEELCALLKQEVNRFWDCKKRDKMFRVASKVKKRAGILSQMCYTTVTGG